LDLHPLFCVESCSLSSSIIGSTTCDLAGRIFQITSSMALVVRPSRKATHPLTMVLLRAMDCSLMW
jgi:hypothetical protein